jgi:hypothetical protein
VIIFTALHLLSVQQGPHLIAMAEANEAASICAIREGVRLDDRRTSPDIVARAGMASCFTQLNDLEKAIKRSAEVEMPTVPNADRQPLIQSSVSSAKKRIEDLVIQAILEQRKLKRAPNQ